MITVDIETSGTNIEKCGIWQIGAIDIANPKQTFLQEARIEKEYEFLFDGNWKGKKPEETLGQTENQLRSKNKQSEKKLLEKFFKWVKKRKNETFVCQNPQFDHAFLEQKARKYNLIFPTTHRAFDLHTLAHFKFYQLNKKFEMKNKKSDFGLRKILNFCGIEDKRKFHNALEDAKLTAEAFSRIVYGKPLLKEYKNYKIPKHLIK